MSNAKSNGTSDLNVIGKPFRKVDARAKCTGQTKFADDLFDNKKSSIDEIESDGSGSAFEETESVNEDNFDDLSEK